MTNLQAMKQNIFEQIQNMNATEFYNLVNLLSGDYSPDAVNHMDLTHMFSCDKCREVYGDCEDDDDSKICLERFIKVAASSSLQ